MRDRLKKNSSTKALVIALAGSAILLACQVTSWAVTKCQQPNPSTSYCEDIEWPVLYSCTESTTACFALLQMDRKKFPNGPVEAASGATTEDDALCWRTAVCVYDEDEGTCVSSNNWNPWQNEDKTVDDPRVTCPTEEE